MRSLDYFLSQIFLSLETFLNKTTTLNIFEALLFNYKIKVDSVEECSPQFISFVVDLCNELQLILKENVAREIEKPECAEKSETTLCVLQPVDPDFVELPASSTNELECGERGHWEPPTNSQDAEVDSLTEITVPEISFSTLAHKKGEIYTCEYCNRKYRTNKKFFKHVCKSAPVISEPQEEEYVDDPDVGLISQMDGWNGMKSDGDFAVADGGGLEALLKAASLIEELEAGEIDEKEEHAFIRLGKILNNKEVLSSEEYSDFPNSREKVDEKEEYAFKKVSKIFNDREELSSEKYSGFPTSIEKVDEKEEHAFKKVSKILNDRGELSSEDCSGFPTSHDHTYSLPNRMISPLERGPKKMKKNRKARFRKFNAVESQQLIMALRDKKAYNVVIHNAVWNIASLKREGKGFEGEFNNLTLKNLAFEHKLSVLKDELISQSENVDLNNVLQAMLELKCGRLGDPVSESDEDCSINLYKSSSSPSMDSPLQYNSGTRHAQIITSLSSSRCVKTTTFRPPLPSATVTELPADTENVDLNIVLQAMLELNSGRVGDPLSESDKNICTTLNSSSSSPFVLSHVSNSGVQEKIQDSKHSTRNLCKDSVTDINTQKCSVL